MGRQAPRPAHPLPRLTCSPAHRSAVFRDLTEARGADRRRALPAGRHLWRLCPGRGVPQDIRRGRRGGHSGAILANPGLVRGGVVADLFQATVWIFVALTLYRLLKHVDQGVAGAMVVLAAVGAGITCLNAVFEFEALRVVTGAVNLSALGPAGSNALALLLVDAHHFGLLSLQIFSALWLAPMGYLAYKSGLFPRALSVVLMVSCVSYLVDLLAALLVPEVSVQIHGFLSIPPAIAEPWMVGYLLIIGVRTVKPAARIRAALATA